MNSYSSATAAVSLPDWSNAVEVAASVSAMKERGVYGFDGIDPRSRSFNLIRSRLIDFQRKRGARLFGVVSATPRVGKSFVAGNLAAALSRNPRFRTTLIDLDLRRGSVSLLFGLEREGTLLDWLAGEGNDPALAAFRIEGEALTIVPTQARLVQSSELLSGKRALSLFEAMRHGDASSLFIVDLPPAFANDDASIVLSRLDAYVLVAEEGKTTKRELTDVIGMLGQERLAGVVLNKYRGGLVSDGYGVADYYGGNYGATAPVE